MQLAGSTKVCRPCLNPERQISAQLVSNIDLAVRGFVCNLIKSRTPLNAWKWIYIYILILCVDTVTNTCMYIHICTYKQINT